ncbi:MAG: NHL repeat-containing protein [Vicinamibacteria bacterium]
MRRAVAVPLVLVAAALAARPALAGSTVLNHGRRLAVGPGHFLVLTDPDLDRVAVYDVGGDRPKLRVAFGEPGQKTGQLASPHGAALSARGDLFVADSYNHRVQAFDLTATLEGWPGRLLRTWGGYGSGPGDFNAPIAGLALPPPEAKQKRVFVADTRNHRVQVFDLDGAPAGLVIGGRGDAPGKLDTPSGIAFDPAGTRLYVAESGNRRVSAFSADTGAFLFAFGADVLRSPAGIAADSRGDLLVTDVGTRLVHRFRPEPAGDPQGARQVGSWGRSGGGNGEWIYPQAIAVDARDRVYVADLASKRCQMFAADGAYLASFGEDLPLGYPKDAPPGHGDPATPTRATCSNGGRYRVRVDAPEPFPANELFALTAEVEQGCDPPRRPASPRLRVDGGMPAHRHGMNTDPVVTPLGGGRYQVKGVLLHMLGRWELYFDLTEAGVTERAQLDVVLE